MRQVVDLHSRLGSVPIGGIRIGTRSRDDIPALPKGLQLIRYDEGTEPVRGSVHWASLGGCRLDRVLWLAGGCARPSGSPGTLPVAFARRCLVCDQ